jgi:hypothetical protein
MDFTDPTLRRAWHRARYWQRRQQGGCVRCGGVPLPGKVRCAACREQARQTQARYRMRQMVREGR